MRRVEIFNDDLCPISLYLLSCEEVLGKIKAIPISNALGERPLLHPSSILLQNKRILLLPIQPTDRVGNFRQTKQMVISDGIPAVPQNRKPSEFHSEAFRGRENKSEFRSEPFRGRENNSEFRSVEQI
jgi:hypothetical protein